MFSARQERVFVRDLTDLKLQEAFDNWWSAMNVETPKPIKWSGSRSSSSWRFFRHCAIEENGIPGIICIVCQQVLSHPSTVGTSSMGKHLLSKGHRAKLDELTESNVAELPKEAGEAEVLAALKKQGSQGLMVVCVQQSNNDILMALVIN